LRRNIPLQRDGAGDGFDDAPKLDKQSVAGGLDDASLVLGDLRVDQIAAQRPEARKGAGLVPFHKTAVPRDIRRKDGGEPALDPLCTQAGLSGGRPAQARPLVGSKSALCASAEGGSSTLNQKGRTAPAGPGQNLPAYSKWPLRLALVRR
jgi:hypothetical protein